MDVREKLIEILRKPIFPHKLVDPVEAVADYLLDNGVTVQEWISVDDRLPEEKVNCIVHYKHAYCDNDDYWAIGMCFYDGEKFQLARHIKSPTGCRCWSGRKENNYIPPDEIRTITGRNRPGRSR